MSQGPICPVCGARDHRDLYVTRDRHYGIPGSYRLVKCTNCGLVSLDPMLSDTELSALYPSDYYAYQDNFHPSVWRNFLKSIAGIRIGTEEPAFAKPGRVLDLGCGTGWHLQKMRKDGWETYGVEINSVASEIGRTRAGLNIFCGTIEEARFQDDFFDYVRSNHSFEHLSTPVSVLDEIHRILKPNGTLLIGVPNIGSFNAKLFGKYWWYLGAPVHPFNYSVKTLSTFLQKQGFTVQQVNYNSDYSGILGSAQMWANRSNGRKSTEGSLIQNPILKVLCHWAAKCIDLFKAGDAIEIVASKPGIAQ